jgi:hypothetical protein
MHCKKEIVLAGAAPYISHCDITCTWPALSIYRPPIYPYLSVYRYLYIIYLHPSLSIDVYICLFEASSGQIRAQVFYLTHSWTRYSMHNVLLPKWFSWLFSDALIIYTAKPIWHLHGYLRVWAIMEYITLGLPTRQKCFINDYWWHKWLLTTQRPVPPER